MIQTIAVEKIGPNPFRLYKNLTKEEKEIVSSLKESIKNIGVWTNIIVRPDPNKLNYYQEAFGKKRLHAIRELGIKEIEVNVENLNDIEMLQHLAFENTTNKKTIGFIIELIEGSKKILYPYLEKEYKKIPNNLKYCFTKESFELAKKRKKISGTIIYKFLRISISENDIQVIKQILEDKSDVKTKDILNFNSIRKVRTFSQSIHSNKIEQKNISKLAKECINENLTESQIDNKIKKHNTFLKNEYDPILHLMNLAHDINNDMQNLRTKILKYFNLLDKENTSLGFNQEMVHSYNYQQLTNLLKQIYTLHQKMLEPEGDKECQLKLISR